MGFFDSIGDAVSNLGKGIGNVVKKATKIIDNPLTRAAAPVISAVPGWGTTAAAVIGAANIANAPTSAIAAATSGGSFAGSQGAGAAQPQVIMNLDRATKASIKATIGNKAFQQIKRQPLSSLSGMLTNQIVSPPQFIVSKGSTTVPGLITGSSLGGSVLGNLFPALPGVGAVAGRVATAVATGVGASQFFSSTPKKRRRMNPMNVRAFRRASRRVRSGMKLLRKLERTLPTRTVHVKATSKRK